MSPFVNAAPRRHGTAVNRARFLASHRIALGLSPTGLNWNMRDAQGLAPPGMLASPAAIDPLDTVVPRRRRVLPALLAAVLLAAAAGYEPTPWEQSRLAEAEACIQAAGTLACQACGCTGGDRCPVRYDRDNDRPLRECAWDCTRHKTGGA